MNLLARLFLVCFFCLCGATPAQAQILPPSSATCSKKNLDVISLTTIDSTVKQFVGVNQLQLFGRAGEKIGQVLVDAALSLAGVLMLLAILAGIASAMSNGKSVTGSVVDNMIMGAIVAVVLKNYSRVADFAIGGADQLNKIVGGDPGAVALKFIASFFLGIATMFSEMMQGFSCLAWWEVIVGALDFVLALAIMLLAVYLAVLAMVEIVQIILMGPVLLGVGIAVGPLFIATLASRATKSWFDRWIGFLTGAMILQFVALVMMGVLSAAISSVGTFNSQFGFTGQAIGIALVMTVVGKLFAGVPGIVSALVPANLGMAGGGGAAAAAVKSIAPAPARVAATAAGAASAGGAVASSASTAAKSTKSLF